MFWAREITKSCQNVCQAAQAAWGKPFKNENFSSFFFYPRHKTPPKLWEIKYQKQINLLCILLDMKSELLLLLLLPPSFLPPLAGKSINLNALEKLLNDGRTEGEESFHDRKITFLLRLEESFNSRLTFLLMWLDRKNTINFCFVVVLICKRKVSKSYCIYKEWHGVIKLWLESRISLTGNSFIFPWSASTERKNNWKILSASCRKTEHQVPHEVII